MSTLIIVESPAKAKTIKKYLGSGYKILASNGHIRDLPKTRLGVDIENNFEPKYSTIRGKSDIVKKLRTEAQKSKKVYLATDPDREGEAISWHLANILKLDLSEPNRVSFNEITKTSVQNGIKNPRNIDLNLVDAQQTRRIVDRIVGYKLSPFLWKKIRKGLSAGRVQSVALKIIVDRENEIRQFEPVEYWSIDASLFSQNSNKPFGAKLESIDGKKAVISNEEQAMQIVEDLKQSDFIVNNVKSGTRKRSPLPPFITSTLQQDASNKIGFTANRSMRAAQELYEGREIKNMGAVGLITYMRTDSLRISTEAQQSARDYIVKKFGKEYVPEKNNVYKSKSSAQDAHEAIRPTMPDVSPEDIKESLTSDQYKIYKLIWQRFMASQMSAALYDTQSVDILAKDKYIFKSSGNSLKFAGYTIVYDDSTDKSNKIILPQLEQGELLKVKTIDPNQHFTQPPPRFSEASLIKELEENGIGRPSTYAPTISTITQREYIIKESKQLIPTDLGEIVSKLIDDNFHDVVNVHFTAEMENELDMIADGGLQWKDVLKAFYGKFSETLKTAEENSDGIKILVPSEQTDEVCEICGKPMVVKYGRFGKFLACSGFPECKNAKRIEKVTNGLCPLCGDTILIKTSKNKKTYYGCKNAPNCEFMTWDLPISDVCPKCGNTLFKKNGKKGKIYCAKENCGYVKD